jgi:hypothetical protein
MEADALRLPARYGINIDATDISGNRGVAQINGAISLIRNSDSIILSGIISKVSDLHDHAMGVEDQISRTAVNNSSITRIITISDISVYSASSIAHGMNRFSTVSGMAAYASHRRDQSGSMSIRRQCIQTG